MVQESNPLLMNTLIRDDVLANVSFHQQRNSEVVSACDLRVSHDRSIAKACASPTVLENFWDSHMSYAEGSRDCGLLVMSCQMDQWVSSKSSSLPNKRPSQRLAGSEHHPASLGLNGTSRTPRQKHNYLSASRVKGGCLLSSHGVGTLHMAVFWPRSSERFQPPQRDSVCTISN